MSLAGLLTALETYMYSEQPLPNQICGLYRQGQHPHATKLQVYSTIRLQQGPKESIWKFTAHVLHARFAFGYDSISSRPSVFISNISPHLPISNITSLFRASQANAVTEGVQRDRPSRQAVLRLNTMTW